MTGSDDRVEKKYDAKHNSSCNSCVQHYSGKLSAIEKRIYEILLKTPEPLTPKQITEKLNEDTHRKLIPTGTVRPILRKMKTKGVIKQPYSGAYCDKITYDVRFHPLLVHNVRMHFLTEESLESWETTEVVGGVKVHVHFGSERHKVSGWISYDRGMNRPACMLAVDRWIAICEKRLGREVKDLVLTTCEVNRDYDGCRLDGEVHCVSKKVFKDTLERVYQREDAVRHEFRLMKNMTLTQFDMIFNQGLDSVIGVQTVYDNSRELAELRQAQTFMNRRMMETKDSVQAIEQKIVKQAEIDDVVTRLIAQNNVFLEGCKGKSFEVEQLKQLFTGQTELVNTLAKRSMELTDIVANLTKALIETREQQQSENRSQPLNHVYE